MDATATRSARSAARKCATDGNYFFGDEGAPLRLQDHAPVLPRGLRARYNHRMAGDALDFIASKIAASSREPTLIAIEGFGGSGKTTLAHQLADLLQDAHVVHFDDFIIKEKLTEQSWDKGAFDRRRLERQVLLPLREHRPAAYQKLIWDSNTLTQPQVLPEVRFVLVEGISSYHPSIAHYYDYKIWVDTPMAFAKARGQARDGANENAGYWDLWVKNDLAYQIRFRPELRADFIIKNG